MANPLVTRASFVVAAVSCCVLCGCSVRGSAVVDATDLVAVDVTVWTTSEPRSSDAYGVPNPAACDDVRRAVGDLPHTLQFTAVRMPQDSLDAACHVSGTVPLSTLAAWGRCGKVSNSYVFQAVGMLNEPENTALLDNAPDLSITFPIPVTAHDPDSQVSGNTVIWEHPEEAQQLTAVAAPEVPHPEVSFAALGGLFGGIAGALALRQRRRRRTTRPGSEAALQDVEAKL